MKKRLIFLIAALIVASMANSVFASTWVGGAGNWDDPYNWAPPGVPDGTSSVEVYGTESDATIDSDVSFTSWYSNRARFFGGATVIIQDGGNLTGMGWLRIGEASRPEAAEVIQTGGMLKFVNGGYHGTTWEAGKDTARLTISDGGGTVGTGKGTYTISGGTLTYDKVTANTGQLTIGDRQGNGTLKIIGTGGTIDMGQLEMGGRIDMVNRQSTATLAFDVESDGVSAVQVARSLKYAGSTTLLVVNVVAALADPDADILLVDNTSADATAQIFDKFNTNDGTEGSWADIDPGAGVLMKQLTYVGGDGNDIMLIPEPATLALLSLGMFVIERKK